VAQTKRKRRSKHRGNAAGTIETRGRTGRSKASPEQQKAAAKKASGRQTRAERLAQPPSWNRATLRAGAASVLLFVLTQIGLFQDEVPVGQAIVVCLVAMLIYIPLGYAFDNWMYKRMNRPKPPKD
jgi:hypothetical protein